MIHNITVSLLPTTLRFTGMVDHPLWHMKETCGKKVGEMISVVAWISLPIPLTSTNIQFNIDCGEGSDMGGYLICYCDASRKSRKSG